MDKFDVMDVNQKQRDRIAELEEENHAWAEKWMVERDENYRLRRRIAEFLDTDPYYNCTTMALRRLEGEE